MLLNIAVKYIKYDSQHIFISFRRMSMINEHNYDSEVDALYIRFIENTFTTKHNIEGIAIDYVLRNYHLCTIGKYHN